jgi:ABC-2 type transport system ATP-binding protein
MKRRLNIACSLLHAPQLVLLDEPTVGVDPQSRERIYEMLAALQRDRVSIVLTTHHLEEAEQRCERIVIIDHGKSVAEGTLSQLVGRTLGEARSVRVSLVGPWPEALAAPDGLTIDDDRRALRATIRDVGRELPALIQHVAAHGGAIADVNLAGARLHDVFIALTGRELRE